MKITSAEFITSAVNPKGWPGHPYPEVAFAGRSNVGKSSLINRLVNRKALAKTSGKPGRTRTINFFLINEKLCFVDLPGYGYAKVSKKERAKWGEMIEAYLIERANLKGFILIIDSRHDLSPLDMQMVHFLDHHQIPYLTVATKADKVRKTKLSGQIASLACQMGGKGHEVVGFSALTGMGAKDVWAWIARAALV